MNLIMNNTDIRFPNLGIVFENLGNGISIGDFSLKYYGIIIGIGMILAILLVEWMAKKTGQNPDDYIDLAFFAIIIGIVGARLYYVAFNFDNFKGNLLSILNLRTGGLAIYGGAIFGVTTAYIYCKKKKMNLPLVFDTGILGLLVGQIIGRWGNFFNRDRTVYHHIERHWLKVQRHTVHLEQLHILLHQSILGLGKYAPQCLTVEGLQIGKNRESAHKLGYQAELLEVHGLHILQHVVTIQLLTFLVALEAYNIAVKTGSNGALDAVEGTATDEQYVACVYLDELLLGVLASSLGRHIDIGALEKLQQSLLHTLAADVARNAGILALAGYLVNLVDEHYATLASLNVVVGSLQQAHKHILHVVAHISRLGQRGGVGYAEGHIQQLRNGARQQRLAGAGLTHHYDVALLYLHLVLVTVQRIVAQALVVVVHCHRQHLLGCILAYDILVQEGLYLRRRRYRRLRVIALAGRVLDLLLEYPHCLLGAVVAYQSVQAAKQHTGLRGRTPAERAVFFVSWFLRHL